MKKYKNTVYIIILINIINILHCIPAYSYGMIKMEISPLHTLKVMQNSLVRTDTHLGQAALTLTSLGKVWH